MQLVAENEQKFHSSTRINKIRDFLQNIYWSITG